MDELITQIKATLKKIDNDITAINNTRLDSMAIARLELMKDKLNFDIQRLQRLELAIDSYNIALQQHKYIYEEFTNG